MADLIATNSPASNALLVVAGLFVVLLIGTAARLTLLRAAPAEVRNQKIGSLKSWWVMAAVFTVIVLLGPVAGILVMAIASLLGLREFFQLTSCGPEGRELRVLACLAVPLNYLWIYLEWYRVYWTFIPVGMFLLLPIRVILADRTEGFVRSVTGVTWGLLLTVFCLSHAAMLLMLPSSGNPAGGATGWFMYLVLLTETDDIAQALWGRKLGRRKVAPHVSPNKTWEGLILGVLSTLVVSVALAPVLTPLANGSGADSDEGLSIRLLQPLLAGLVICVGGFFGDLTMSAVKRDLHVKDAGTLIPGQGGLLDRIDSLTFAAPVFYYYVLLNYG